ncbi:HIT family protein [Paludibacterium paludis]|uniref:HIT family protein n=1 Tax=Paludibacterium paludis TaxID=1225769 RepID=A0A918NZV5_9NEIS|nr:HIT family protein [Paludibacterium paludis]GGY09978.1 HIT family protein [Paludibacterium paludis]
MNCELCAATAGEILFENSKLRVVLADEAGYPGFCRVIWREHIKEMTDLSADDARLLFDWVLRTERALRDVMRPEKINLATLGNMVPHLHWHVIPRFADDPHFPAPVWAAPRREPALRDTAGLAGRLRAHLQGD